VGRHDALTGCVTSKVRIPKLSADQDQIGHQFALATARLEDALAVAVEGQNGRLTRAMQRRVHRRLVRAIAKCTAQADAIGQILEH
jgi:hypothetical protein